MQSTGSFKVRGAYNKISCLDKKDLKLGVVCASAGNHAQGVAYAARSMDVKATVFMPIFTPPLKVIATRSYGAEVVLTGDTFDDAYERSITTVPVGFVLVTITFNLQDTSQLDTIRQALDGKMKKYEILK